MLNLYWISEAGIDRTVPRKSATAFSAGIDCLDDVYADVISDSIHYFSCCFVIHPYHLLEAKDSSIQVLH